MRIIDVIRLKTCAQTFVEHVHQLVKRARLARAEIVNSARFRIERVNAALHRILHIDEISFLLAVLENAGALAGFHLSGQMIDHAGGHALVRLARPINVEVTQPNNDPVRILSGFAHGDVVHDDF